MINDDFPTRKISGCFYWRFTLQFLLAVSLILMMLVLVVCLKKLWRNAPAGKALLRWPLLMYSVTWCKKCQSRRQTMRHFAHEPKRRVIYSTCLLNRTLFFGYSLRNFFSSTLRARWIDAPQKRWNCLGGRFPICFASKRALCADRVDLCANNENVLPTRSPRVITLF